MKTLPTEFTKNGWHHQQIIREGLMAVYRRWKETSPAPHYETIIIREQPERAMAGVTVPATEAYPSDVHFGKMGWSYPTEEKAMEKFRELQARPKKTKP